MHHVAHCGCHDAQLRADCPPRRPMACVTRYSEAKMLGRYETYETWVEHSPLRVISRQMVGHRLTTCASSHGFLMHEEGGLIIHQQPHNISPLSIMSGPSREEGSCSCVVLHPIQSDVVSGRRQGHTCCTISSDRASLPHCFLCRHEPCVAKTEFTFVPGAKQPVVTYSMCSTPRHFRFAYGLSVAWRTRRKLGNKLYIGF